MMLTATLLVLVATAGAQEKCKADKKTPEEIAQFQAEMIADKLMLNDKDAAAFIPLYKEYRIAVMGVETKYAPACCKGGKCPSTMTDADVDKFFRDGFAKEQELLNLHIAYYDKFGKVLTPKQIKMIRDTEKACGEMKAKGFGHGKCNPQGHKGDGKCPQGHNHPHGGMPAAHK